MLIIKKFQSHVDKVDVPRWRSMWIHRLYFVPGVNTPVVYGTVDINYSSLSGWIHTVPAYFAEAGLIHSVLDFGTRRLFAFVYWITIERVQRSDVQLV